MERWIYLGDNKHECSKCMFVVQSRNEPKKCPNCDSKMMNAFSRLFPPNNVVLKKDERGTLR